jgi:eukaryotic-like serine/threonine-protein kinase
VIKRSTTLDRSILGAQLPRVGDILLEKYRVDAHLGEGGMGVVLAAYHMKLERNVALKVLHPNVANSTNAVTRFAREGRAAARLKGPHVTRIFDVEETDNGLPFLVMEHLTGEDLATRLAKEGRIPVEVAVDLVLQACEALAEAHAQGVVHRDLKPENLYLAKLPEGSTILKLLDFGISKLLLSRTDEVLDATRTATLAGSKPLKKNEAGDTKLTDADSLMGTPRYMSPEQILSPTTVDQRADIWALGIILFELLSGETPFNGSTASEIIIAITTEPLPELNVGLGIPIPLLATAKRCLEKNPLDRFPNIASLAIELAPFGGPRAFERLDRVLGYSGRAPLARPIKEKAVATRLRRHGLALTVGIGVLAIASWRLYPPTTRSAGKPEVEMAAISSAPKSLPLIEPPETKAVENVSKNDPPVKPRVRRLRAVPRNPLTVDIQR